MLATAAPARAESDVDPRYPYTLELAVGGLLFGDLHGAGVSGFAPSVRASFAGPLAENVQGIGAFWIDSEQHQKLGGASSTVHHSTLLGGLRFRYPFEKWATFVDTEVAADVWPAFAIGARGAFGGFFRAADGFDLGASVGVSFVAVNPRGAIDFALLAAYSW